MTTPLSNRPKLTQNDINEGYIMRYFVQHISIPKIIEVDKKQYDIFSRDPLYRTISFKWMISGFANNVQTEEGTTIYGVQHQNTVTLTWYNSILPGLNRILTNPLEYFTGIYNK